MKENKNTTNSTTSEERMNTIQAYQGKDEEMREGGKNNIWKGRIVLMRSCFPENLTKI